MLKIKDLERDCASTRSHVALTRPAQPRFPARRSNPPSALRTIRRHRRPPQPTAPWRPLPSKAKTCGSTAPSRPSAVAKATARTKESGATDLKACRASPLRDASASAEARTPHLRENFSKLIRFVGPAKPMRTGAEDAAFPQPCKPAQDWTGVEAELRHDMRFKSRALRRGGFCHQREL